MTISHSRGYPITWIIPMAGRGKRVQNYGQCKPAIKIHSKPIFQWCLAGFSKHIQATDTICFITTVDHEEKYGLSTIVAQALVELNVSCHTKQQVVNDTPRGPSSSVYSTKDIINTPHPCVVINCDQFCDFEFPKTLDWQGFIPVHYSQDPGKSYALVENGIVKDIQEKKVISNLASSGVYGFANSSVLFGSIEQSFNEYNSVNGEYFISSAVKQLVSREELVIPTSTFAKLDLGTSRDILRFNSLPIRLKNIAVSLSQ